MRVLVVVPAVGKIIPPVAVGREATPVPEEGNPVGSTVLLPGIGIGKRPVGVAFGVERSELVAGTAEVGKSEAEVENAALVAVATSSADEVATFDPAFGYRDLIALVHQSLAIHASNSVIVIEAPAFMMNDVTPVGVQS